jgi:hypothetical protein
MLRFNNFILLSIVTLLLLTGCQPRKSLEEALRGQRGPVKRTYHEIVQSAPQPSAPMRPVSGEPGASSIPNDDVHAFLRDMPMPPGVAGDRMQEMLNASVTKPPLSWQTPDGWQESPGSGMRLATFKSADTGDPVECALISLSGAAGGLESNAARWMGQLKLEVLSGEKMQKFLASQKKIKTPDGLPATIIDLAGLQPESDPRAPSMIGTILELDSMTVFVKMTGSRGAVLKNKDKFEELCESLKLH